MSYRRRDVPEVALEIRNALREKLFKDAFFDTRSLEGGESWPKAIRRELARSDVVFVIVGPHWEPGRLNDQDDFVRAELVAARRNWAVVTPLLVGIDEMPAMNDLPQALDYLPNQQSGGKLPNDTKDENLWRLSIGAAGPPATRARRRKWIVRLCLVGAVALTSAAVWFVQRPTEACDTDDLDVGVAVRLDDRRSSSDGTSSPEAGIADGLADVLQSVLESSPGVNVKGPQECGPLGSYRESELPEVVAADAELDVLVTGDLVAADQESQLGLFLTFDTLAVPDAPEVSGTHRVSETVGGKDISPGVVAERFQDELRHVASVLDGTQRYASGQYAEAADRFARLSAELSGEADSSLLRVTELLRANSVLLQARSLRETDVDAATTLYDTALAIYARTSEVDGVSYGRAYLGIGEVWVERCRSELAGSGDEPSRRVVTDGVVAGLAAFDTAQQVAALDPATEVEVGLKSALGRGNLALCGMLLASDAERRIELAGQAEDSFQAVVEDAAAVERFDNLASEGNVGLAGVDLVRCNRSAPESAIELALDHLETARPGALPSQSADVDEAIELLDRALSEGMVELEGQGPLSSSLGALVIAACGLPPA